jgi:hypothetical protein
MKNTIRITIAALLLSFVAACSTTSEHPPVCRDGKTCAPVAKH